MRCRLTILGSNSALPANNRHPSAQIITTDNTQILIDCGEGCQIQFNRFGIKRSRLSTILISHMHGDHIFGLPGLITSYNHYGRSAPLTIYGPPGIRDFIMTSLKYTGNPIAFPMDIIEFNPASEQLLTEKDDLRIYTLPLVHRIPTAGFRLESIEKEYHLIPEALEKYNIPIDVRKELKTGKDYIDPEGNIIPNANFTTPPRQSWKYAYISDTAFVPEIVTKIRNYDLIYHEATFHTLFSAKARDTKHSTAAQAATIARNAGVKELIIGHFSSRYKDLNVLLLEAKALFPNTHLAIEGKSFDID